MNPEEKLTSNGISNDLTQDQAVIGGLAVDAEAKNVTAVDDTAADAEAKNVTAVDDTAADAEAKNVTAVDDTAADAEAKDKKAAPVLKLDASEKITVTMTESALFDFFLYHAYSKFNGFLINILGFAIFILGVFSYATGRIDSLTCFFFVLFSVLFLGSTPLQLKFKVKKVMQEEKMYQTPMEFTFTDLQGIRVEQAGCADKLYPWPDVVRAAVTPKNIAIYVGKDQALIIPKQCFGTKFLTIYQIIARNIAISRPPKKK
jgi:hypothetical protein